MRVGRTLVLTLCFFVATLVLVDASPSWAQLRKLPANAQRAVLSGYQNPFVILGNKQLRLAPGAVIFDANNRTILRGSLPAEADVVFTTDQTGNVLRIYLLTAQERQMLDQAKR